MTLIRTAMVAMLMAMAGCESAERSEPYLEPLGFAGGEMPEELANHHADVDAELTAQSVGQLQPAWTFDPGENVTHMPLVDAGVLYTADWGGEVFALDARTGRPIWRAQVEQPRTEWPWHGFAGTGALDEATLYEASVEGNVFAIDRGTGDVRWQKRFVTDPHAGSLARLMVYDGVLYLGVQSVEEPLSKMQQNFEVNFQGQVVALDAATGRELWRLPLVLPPNTGVPMWTGFALDPALGTLYFTTGNNYTGEATELSDSLVAVDAKTGSVKWHRQVVPHDVWTMAEPKGPDYDFTGAPQLFAAEIDGQPRELVGAGNKSGTYHVWDRRTGGPIWTTTVGYGHVGGGIHADASIGRDRIFIWGNHAYPYGKPNEHPMDIKAVDARSGEYIWVSPKAQPAALTSAGFLAGDIYFVPSLDGMIRGYRASDGKHVWTSQKHAAIGSSLLYDNGMLYFGTGVPKRFGGDEAQGGKVIAYGAGRPQVSGR